MTFEDNTQNVAAIAHDFNKISKIIGLETQNCQNKKDLLSYHFKLINELHDQEINDNQVELMVGDLSKHLFEHQKNKLEQMRETNLPLNNQIDYVMEEIRQNLAERPLAPVVESVKEY